MTSCKVSYYVCFSISDIKCRRADDLFYSLAPAVGSSFESGASKAGNDRILKKQNQTNAGEVKAKEKESIRKVIGKTQNSTKRRTAPQNERCRPQT